MPLPDLPYLTPELPGTGGQIKAEPEHFIVEEIPLYPPNAGGDHGDDHHGDNYHLFVSLSRAGQTTRQVIDNLARVLGIAGRDIGYAGLKDRQARATQVFSLPGVSAERAQAAAEALGYELHWAATNRRKLQTGHLLGNHFTITVLHPTAAQPVALAQKVVEALQQRGLPNYFGAQRFGRMGDNAAQGLGILTGERPKPGDRWLYRLLTSAYQSQLFNDYLALRIRRGWFDRLLPGDMAKKTDTGGMFVVADVAIEQPRFDRGEITFTGPLFGYDMWGPEADAAALEAEILSASPVTPADWRKHRVEGNRRPGRLFLREVAIHPHPEGYVLSFFLPKGAYATMLLREIIKSEFALMNDEVT